MKLTTLQRPKTDAGLALLNIYLYHLAGQLEHLRTWVTQEQRDGVERHLLEKLQVEDLMIGLEVKTISLPRVKIPMMTLARAVWREAKN